MAVPDLLPTSLLARTNLTLGASSLAIVVIAIVAINGFVIQPITERSAQDEAALMVLSLQTWAELPPEARLYFELEMAESHDLILSADVRELPLAETIDPYAQLLAGKLGERLGGQVELRESDELYWANVEMGGYDLQLGFSATRRDIQPLYVAIIISVLGAAIVFATSLYLVTRITRPLVQAAQRAETFRGAQDFELLPEQGPAELVSLAKNFNTMARDISALLANRTTLLSGISHDLRTPITRMRLAVELLPDSVEDGLKLRLERNLEAMDTLIQDALQFARGTVEPLQKLDLPELLTDILAGTAPGLSLVIESSPAGPVAVAPGALRRVLVNLVNNAHTYGEDVAVVLAGTQVRVLDSGPGIPVDQREAVFEPFFRLESSRSATTGGSGLGLAIVRQLCQAHGWKISIHNRHEERHKNGLKVGTCVELTLEPALNG